MDTMGKVKSLIYSISKSSKIDSLLDTLNFQWHRLFSSNINQCCGFTRLW